MKRKIVAYKPLPDDVLAYLQQHAEVVQADAAQHDAFVAALNDADGAIGASVKITPAMLDGATKLKALSTISVGYDNFDVADLTKRGIVLAHTPDVLTESTADTVFSLILASARRVVELANFVKAGEWKASIGPELYGVDVQGKTLGIVGLGRIGGAVARRAALGFNMKVLYTNRSANAEAEERYGARRVDLDELLATSDFVCLQVPLTPDTRHMIGANELRKMKKSAILINASRGQTVDEYALIEALQSGTIHGAGLDVFDKEPLDPNSPLLKMNNVVALPHIGSATHETRHAMARCAAENLVGALDGTLKINIVNRDVLSQ
ncbi:2-hydroxyacid dehydrogenase [Paraburkholderia sabiae]|uniref:D-glycerate dehydrogenase n=1 Tax=Paraburkholderia sabiae TaxID=273251 RepID=A0ABU9QHA2_9BURK|nr:D-glycerate dehydrogenase [Paraburkholderia sabiae]WJZ75591.1 D-glycerate dehydrogenase [Paraburkholderia sabiae]CAD6557435.1 Glyoxylate/hydroxypyruvate reductase B [Paraburkholderia sabiae]